LVEDKGLVVEGTSAVISAELDIKTDKFLS